jgi:NHLM bacteriocin system ABC transporter ATP-binding protein
MAPLPPVDATALPWDTATLPVPAREVGADGWFVLAGPTTWLIDRGVVDLFAVQMEGDIAVGPRTHVVRLTAGQMLVGLSSGHRINYRLVAVPGPETQLRELSTRRLPTLLAPAVLQGLMEQWVEALTTGLPEPRGGDPTVALDGGESRVAPQVPTRVRATKAVMWVRTGSGDKVTLLGEDRLALGDARWVPIGRGGWLSLPSAAALEVRLSHQLPDTAMAWEGLERLHELMLEYAALAAEWRADAQRQLVLRRQAQQAQTMHAAFEGLATSMTAADAPVAPAALAAVASADVDGEAFPALVAACRLVGRSAGITIKSYRPTPGVPLPRDPLEAVLRASRVSSRRVALRGDWWHSDAGPMLAYLQDGTYTRPVALLPSGRGGRYALHDPLRGTADPITPAVAEKLEPFAVTLYRAFPDRALAPGDLLTFGLHGARGDLLRVLVLLIGGMLLTMAPPWATALLYNHVLPGAHRAELWQMTALLAACAITTALVGAARGIAILRIEGRMGAALQAAVWHRVLGLPLAFFRGFAVGDLATRAMAIDGIRRSVSGSTVAALLGGALALGNLGMMYHYSVALAWRGSLLIVAVLAVAVVGSWMQLHPQRVAERLRAATAGVVLQLLSAVGKLRVSGAEPSAFALWAGRFQAQRRQQYTVRTIGNVISAILAAFPILAALGLYYWALPLLRPTPPAEPLRTGDLLAFLSAFAASSSSLLGACLALLGTLATVPLYEQARPILVQTPEVDDVKADPGQLTGELEVQHVVFRYEPDGAAILRDVSLRIAAGEFVAFVGASGSGKSTLLRLLLGFETQESGRILFDGQDLAGLDVRLVRRQIGVVLQQGRLMAGDIFTNIVGATPLTINEAWDAARLAGLDKDIEQMPMGMHTVVSEGGGTLSGGQRQRLLIARALVHRPKILLFDEATSALDNRTQAIVGASLAALPATRIVVAHRLSTIEFADRILVFQKGRIVEAGSYRELLARDGVFADLARRQHLTDGRASDALPPTSDQD